MDDRFQADFAAQVAAAFDWWREAGVDCAFADEATRWLAPAASTPAPARPGAPPPPDPVAPPASPPAPAIAIADWPRTLDAFVERWLGDPALDEGRTAGRVPPRGAPGAEVMVIVPEPERDDGERLLCGPQGRLLDAMLLAMGIAPERAYVASVLPRHTPMADWAAIAERGFGALLRHHVGLVGPGRLVALGSNILPLLGHDPAHKPAVSRDFNQEGLTIPLLAGKSLAALLDRPRWKAGLWQGWLDWTGGPSRRG
jgi:DNA polymerase